MPEFLSGKLITVYENSEIIFQTCIKPYKVKLPLTPMFSDLRFSLRAIFQRHHYSRIFIQTLINSSQNSVTA